MAGLIPEYAPITPTQLLGLFDWASIPSGDLMAPDLTKGVI